MSLAEEMPVELVYYILSFGRLLVIDRMSRKLHRSEVKRVLCSSEIDIGQRIRSGGGSRPLWDSYNKMIEREDGDLSRLWLWYGNRVNPSEYANRCDKSLVTALKRMCVDFGYEI